MLLLDEKSNPPAPSSVTYAPVGRSTDAIQTDAGSSEPQDTYDPELPPPAYESVKNAGVTQVSNVDVKSEPATTREDVAESPGDTGLVVDTSTTQDDLINMSSAYARPPAVNQIAGETLSNPPNYIGSSTPTNSYPRYSSPGSFSSPPSLTPPSRNLLSLGNSSSQNQSPELPPSFSRSPPPNLYYTTFPPTYLIANGKHLDNGFPVVPPPSPVQPHPFSSRDVREVDWIRFLRDLKKTATLTSGQRVAAGAVGVLVPGIFTGIYVANAIKKSMKTKKNKPVGELVDNWNYYFFHPRQLEVILARGEDRVDSGPGPVPDLDPQIERMALRLGRTSSRSSSSSSTSRSRSPSPHGKHTEKKRDGKGKHKADKGDERRRGRKAERGRGDGKQYRLFVVGL